MVTRSLILMLLLVSGHVAAGADEAPWETGPARSEAIRVVDAARKMLLATELRDARPAVAALRDPSWQLRRLAISRLQTLGLPERWIEALGPVASPSAPPPEPDWPPLLAAKDYADALEVAMSQAPEITRAAATRAVATLVAERLVDGRDPTPIRHRLLEELLALGPLLPPEDRAWLAAAALTAVDEQALLRDLRRRGLDEAVGRDGRDVLRWFARSYRFLFWHPARGRFELDLGARRAGQSSAEFRVHTPWGDAEGPNGS